MPLCSAVLRLVEDDQADDSKTSLLTSAPSSPNCCCRRRPGSVSVSVLCSEGRQCMELRVSPSGGGHQLAGDAVGQQQRFSGGPVRIGLTHADPDVGVDELHTLHARAASSVTSTRMSCSSRALSAHSTSQTAARRSCSASTESVPARAGARSLVGAVRPPTPRPTCVSLPTAFQFAARRDRKRPPRWERDLPQRRRMSRCSRRSGGSRSAGHEVTTASR